MSVGDVTRILEAAEQDDPKAAEELLPLVYDELRRLAAAKMAKEAPGHTLQPTALVHEAWLRLTRDQNANWEGRTHFLAAAAEAMRRILIESARRKHRLKRGGQWQKVELEEVELPLPMPAEDLLELDGALEKLTAFNARAAEVVKLCFFGGLSQEQAAEALGLSVSTAERLWAFARAWLFREIQKERKSVG